MSDPGRPGQSEKAAYRFMSRTIDGRIWPEADDAANHKAKAQQSFAVSSGGRQARDWVQELVTIMGELVLGPER
jgi:hypothetical protein